MEQQATNHQQEQMNTIITIVLTADNHLGHIISGQHPRKREELRQRLRHAFQQATDFAVGQGVDLFVQVGDLFDTTHPDEQDRSFVAARLAQLKQAGIRVFALGGVHDSPRLTDRLSAEEDAIPAPQMSYARLGALHYFPPGMGPGHSPAGDMHHSEQSGSEYHTLQPVMLDIRGTLVGICGVGVLAGQQGDPLTHVHIESDIERAALSLLLLHAPIEGMTTGASVLDTQAQVSRASIMAQPAFQAVLAGYHHGFKRQSIGRSEVIVAGTTQHIDFSDPDDEPGFVFLGIAADGVRWCRHISVDSLQLRRLVIHAAELWPEREEQADSHRVGAEEMEVGAINQAPTPPTSLVLERLRPLCSENTMVQLRLEGELTRQCYHQLNLNQLRLYGAEHTFALAIDDSGLTFLRDAGGRENWAAYTASGASEVEDRLSPREELIRLADEWIASAEDEQEQKALAATKEELLAALWGGIL